MSEKKRLWKDWLLRAMNTHMWNFLGHISQINSISDVQMNFQISQNGLRDHQGTEYINNTIVCWEMFFSHHMPLIASFVYSITTVWRCAEHKNNNSSFILYRNTSLVFNASLFHEEPRLFCFLEILSWDLAPVWSEGVQNVVESCCYLAHDLVVWWWLLAWSKLCHYLINPIRAIYQTWHTLHDLFQCS